MQTPPPQTTTPHPLAPPPLRAPVPGDLADFRADADSGVVGATIRRVYRPGDADSPVDLVVADGVDEPRVEVYVERTRTGGVGWWLPGDWSQPPTIEEQVAGRELQGERVPRLGERVVLLRCLREHATVRTVPCRARVTRIVAVEPEGVRVDLDWWPGDAPEDPRVPDPPFGRIEHVAQWAGVRRGNHTWCWPDEPVGPFEPVHEDTFLPTDPCPRCGVAVPRHLLVPIRAHGRELARVCEGCVELIATDFQAAAVAS